MFKNTQLFLTAVFVCLSSYAGASSAFAGAMPVISIDSHSNGALIGDNYEFVKPEHSTTAPEDVLHLDIWRKGEANGFGQGLTTDTYWMRFGLSNGEDREHLVYLEYLDALFHEIDVFDRPSRSDQEFRIQSFRLEAPSVVRPVPHHRPAFAITVSPGATQEVLIRLRYSPDIEGPLFTNFYLWTDNEFLLTNDLELSLLMFAGATFFMVSLISLLMFFVLREYTFFFYSLYTSSGAFTLAILTGLFHYFVEFEQDSIQATLYFVLVFQASILLFARSFLNIPALNDWISRLMIAAAIIPMFGVLMNLLGYVNLARSMAELASPTGILIIPVGIYAIYRKVPRATIFTITWAIYVPCMALQALRNTAIIDHSYIVQWAVYFVAYIEILIFTALMALRIADLRREKIEIETRHKLHVETEARRLQTIINQKTEQLTREREKAEQEARTDALTQLPNRRYFSMVVPEAMERAPDTHYLAILDVDHFKSVNDTHGHDVGDQVLVEMGNRLKASARENDLVARLGGEEFGLCFAAHSPDAAFEICERIRKSISDSAIELPQGPLQITTSIGLAQHTTDATYKDTMKKADQALYEAKGEGRNKTVLLAC